MPKINYRYKSLAISAAAVGFGRFQLHGFSFILGQKDLFENIDVLFKRRKETIELIIP